MADMAVKIAHVDAMIGVAGFKAGMAVFAFRQFGVGVALFNFCAVAVQFFAAVTVDTFVAH